MEPTCCVAPAQHSSSSRSGTSWRVESVQSKVTGRRLPRLNDVTHAPREHSAQCCGLGNAVGTARARPWIARGLSAHEPIGVPTGGFGLYMLTRKLLQCRHNRSLLVEHASRSTVVQSGCASFVPDAGGVACQRSKPSVDIVAMSSAAFWLTLALSSAAALADVGFKETFDGAPACRCENFCSDSPGRESRNTVGSFAGKHPAS